MRLILFLSFLMIAGCAPQEQTFTGAPARKAQLAATAFHADDGAALPLKTWLPQGKPKAVILAVHGFNDYSRAFDHAGKYFRKRGVATYAYDQRGFGGAPHPGIWAGQANLVHDLKTATALLKERHPGAPLYLLGESMGGAVALSAAAEEAFPDIDGIVLVAPAVWGEDSLNPLYRATLWLLAHSIPDHTFTGEDLGILATDNIPLLRAMSDDPLVIKETRADAIYGLMRIMDKAYASAPLVKKKALLLYGERDEVIPRLPIRSIAERYGGEIKTVYYPEGYHMLLRDRQREAVMRDIVRWIEEK